MCFGVNAGLWVDMTEELFNTKELFSHDFQFFFFEEILRIR